VSKLLVLSHVGGEKVLPWMVSTAGNIKCLDTVSLSQKVSLHRHALHPITLHFLCLRTLTSRRWCRRCLCSCCRRRSTWRQTTSMGWPGLANKNTDV
jgi:hypothetical protein